MAWVCVVGWGGDKGGGGERPFIAFQVRQRVLSRLYGPHLVESVGGQDSPNSSNPFLAPLGAASPMAVSSVSLPLASHHWV